MNLARLTTVAGLAELQSADGKPLFPQATVRDWMRLDLRGFRRRCVVMVGGKAYIDLDSLDDWMEDGRGAKRKRSAPAAEPPVIPSEVLLPFAEVRARSRRLADQSRRQRGPATGARTAAP